MNGRVTYLLLLFFWLSPGLSAQDVSHLRENKSSVHGSLSAGGTYYHAAGMEARRPPWAGVLAGNVTINLKGFTLPFAFTYSNQNRSFRQPFNQFGLSPRYKWLTLHLGYRNVNFSRYVLGGHTVFGAGTEMNPGRFRFGFMYGRLNRATNQAVNIFRPTTDTLMDFNRKMMALKIGYGTQKSYFDINLLRAYDDSTTGHTDYAVRSVFPAANLVGGVHTRLQLGSSLFFEGEGAFSIYTDNQNSLLQPEGIPPAVQKIIPVNASSSGKLAVEARLMYQNQKAFRLGVTYRRIAPGYRSMGTYFLNNDVENVTLNGGFRALKKKMQLSGSIGLERNNLQLSRNATTRKTIGSVNLNYNPSTTFGFTATYSNYSINQQPGRIQIADSVKLYQTNGTLVVSPHLHFGSKNKKVQHFLSWVFTDMRLTDKNPESQYGNNFTTLNNILSYSLSLVPSGLNILMSINQNRVRMQSGESTNMGGTLGLRKRFRKPKLSLGLTVTYTRSSNEQRTLNTLTPVFNAGIRLGKHHQFRLRANMIRSSNTQTAQTTTEQIGVFRYVFTF
jgi:hypothetical protein